MLLLLLLLRCPTSPVELWLPLLMPQDRTTSELCTGWNANPAAAPAGGRRGYVQRSGYPGDIAAGVFLGRGPPRGGVGHAAERGGHDQ